MKPFDAVELACDLEGFPEGTHAVVLEDFRPSDEGEWTLVELFDPATGMWLSEVIAARRSQLRLQRPRDRAPSPLAA